MADEKAMEIMISSAQQEEAEEFMEFLKSLDQNEKKEFMVFIQGMKFAKGMEPVKEVQMSALADRKQLKKEKMETAV